MKRSQKQWLNQFPRQKKIAIVCVGQAVFNDLPDYAAYTYVLYRDRVRHLK